MAKAKKKLSTPLEQPAAFPKPVAFPRLAPGGLYSIPCSPYGMVKLRLIQDDGPEHDESRKVKLDLPDVPNHPNYPIYARRDRLAPYRPWGLPPAAPLTSQEK